MNRTLGFLLLILAGYGVFLVIQEGNFFHIGFLLLYIVGMWISLVLLLKTHGFQLKTIDKLCSNKSGGDDCYSVIGSKGAFIAGEISWSDIGAVYFLSMLVVSITFPFDENGLAYVLSSFIAFPYTVFSIYYQWKVVRSWCKLCLMVQIILLLLVSLSVAFLFRDSAAFTLVDFFVMGFVILLIIIGYFTVKYVLKSLLLKRAVLEQYRLFKFLKPECNLFVSERLEPLAGASRIIYHEGAPDKITVAFRFDCNPCLYHMEEVIDIIKEKPDIAVEFIFVSWASRLKKDLPIILYFTLIYLDDPDKFLDALRRYIKDFPLNPDKYSSKPEVISDRVKCIVKSHITWCSKNKINQTPTYLVNDRIVSSYYKFSELVEILTSGELVQQGEVLPNR